MSLVLFTLVDNVSERAWMYCSFSPGFSPCFFQSQLRLSFDCIAVVDAFPLFWCSTCSFSFLISAFHLLSIFSRLNLVSLSSFSGVIMSPVYCPITSSEIFIFVGDLVWISLLWSLNPGCYNHFCGGSTLCWSTLVNPIFFSHASLLTCWFSSPPQNRDHWGGAHIEFLQLKSVRLLQISESDLDVPSIGYLSKISTKLLAISHSHLVVWLPSGILPNPWMLWVVFLNYPTVDDVWWSPSWNVSSLPALPPNSHIFLHLRPDLSHQRII